MPDPMTIVVLEGDETGQELLEQAVRVLSPDVLRLEQTLERFDLSLDNRRAIPALNRDGDCLSDLVLPMFGSIAAAESVLLAFDERYETTVAMADAPHATAPALLGKDLANPLAMILACGAVLRYASGRHGRGAARASRAVYEAALETVASGTKTPQLGGHCGTTAVTDEVVERVRTKLDVWSSIGSRG